MLVVVGFGVGPRWLLGGVQQLLVGAFGTCD